MTALTCREIEGFIFFFFFYTAGCDELFVFCLGDKLALVSDKCSLPPVLSLLLLHMLSIY